MKTSDPYPVLFAKLSTRMTDLEALVAQSDKIRLDRQKQQDKLIQNLLRYMKLKAAHDPELRIFKFLELDDLMPSEVVDRWNDPIPKWMVRTIAEDLANNVPISETARMLGISPVSVAKYRKKLKANVRPN